MGKLQMRAVEAAIVAWLLPPPDCNNANLMYPIILVS